MHLWCHFCQIEFFTEDDTFRCSRCNKDFCEEINDDNNDPRQHNPLVEDVAQGQDADDQWIDAEEQQNGNHMENGIQNNTENDPSNSFPNLPMLIPSIYSPQMPTSQNMFMNMMGMPLGFGGPMQQIQNIMNMISSIPGTGISLNLVTIQGGNSEHSQPPAAQSVIDQLQRTQYQTAIYADGECSICKAELKDEEWVITIPCYHIFHADCLVPWLKIRNSCPTCRYELPTDDPVYEEQRQRQQESQNVD